MPILWRERDQLHSGKPAPTKLDRSRVGAAVACGQGWYGWPVAITAARLGEVRAAASSRERRRRERKAEPPNLIPSQRDGELITHEVSAGFHMNQLCYLMCPFKLIRLCEDFGMAKYLRGSHVSIAPPR